MKFRFYDSKAEYHVYSAHYLDSIRQHAKQPHLIHVLLDETFRAAHKQHNFKDEDGRNIINELRNYRDRNWWDATKKEPWRERKLEEIDQNSQAPATEHQDILDTLLGRDWNATGTTNIQWMRKCRDAANTYYKNNNLPHDYRPKPLTYEERQKQRQRQHRNKPQQEQQQTQPTQTQKKKKERGWATQIGMKRQDAYK